MPASDEDLLSHISRLS